MKTIFFLSVIFFLLTLNACTSDNRKDSEQERRETHTQQDTPVKMIEYLVGEWEMNAAGEGSQNGNEADGPGERITFTSEARYIVHQENQRVDSGAYRMNEQLNNLYLESELNGEPREFEVRLQSDTMTLKPNDGGQNGTAYTYHRVGPSSIPPDKSDNARP